MAGRRTNLALLAALAVTVVSGAATFVLGSSAAAWLASAHGVAALAAVVLSPWKSTVVRQGLRRRRSGRWLSLALAGAVVVALVTGVVHATGAWRARGPWSPMSLHVASGLVVLALLVGHVAARPQRVRSADLSRRVGLQAAAVTAGAVVAHRVVGLAAAPDQRFTGSLDTGSFEPAAMPVVQWLNDPKPSVDVEAWRLGVSTAGRREWSYPELAAFGDEVVATLDCTGGWYSTQHWRGVRVSRVLGPDPPGRSLLVRSVTGYWRRFPLGDADALVLATHLGGKPISRGHGFPVRLVAPDRRGFWWVKWVAELETDDLPWWWQPPLPLS